MPSKNISRRGFLKNVARALVVVGLGTITLKIAGCGPVHVTRREMLRYKFGTPEEKKALEEAFLQRPVFGNDARKRPERKKISSPNSGQWPKIYGIFGWDTKSQNIAYRAGFVDRVSKAANTNPAMVLLAVKERGLEPYHAKALEARAERFAQEAAQAKSKREKQALLQEKAKYEAEARVIRALVEAKKTDRQSFYDLRNSVKDRFFRDWASLENLALE